MTEALQVPRRRRADVRWWTVGVLACGAVLVPATGASANHMKMADGTLCPHATGTGPDAQPQATGPAAPARASSDKPLGPVVKSATPPVTKPAAEAGSQAVTKAPAQRPATVVDTQAAGTTAVAVAPRQQPVSAPVRQVRQPRAVPKPRAAHQPRQASRPASTKDFVPPVTGSADVVLPRASAPSVQVAERQVIPAPAAIVAGCLMLVALAALTAAIVRRRRRGDDGELVEVAPVAPVEPMAVVTHEALVEAELHEMIAEARARELLGGEQPDGEPEAPRVGTPR
jgi:hypothetical protein